MPGILPMKVIKVGSNAQARIAQACDRCRSKKIRCDGFRPTCSQCSNVGFECKTSDKLSRRAFPRGYTESLEERVRALETESRELKDLLDEKDEKIDMLSRVHSQSPKASSASRRASSSASSAPTRDTIENGVQDRSDLFKSHQSPCLWDDEGQDCYFTGTSSGRSMFDALNRRLQESNRSGPMLRADSCFPPIAKIVAMPQAMLQNAAFWKAPPRMLSDQMVNIFFQEWAPMFPILHRPTFLGVYEKYVSGTDSVEDMKCLAQLNLVFGIAALSSGTSIPEMELFEQQWVAALQTFSEDTSLWNLQCLLLAQLYCLQKGDYSKCLYFRSLAVGLSQRLGLHLSQKQFALGTLTIETRKKVMWTLYSLDCFSAAFIGLPRLLKDDDIHCEDPVDVDDEYISEQGFQPTLPGEFTKLSSALAFFRASRIMAKVLESNYSSAPTHELSFRHIAALDDELENWSNNLANHLRLEFVQSKPSTHVISSRCPILSLIYHYIRSMIHRPVVCANLGDKASSSLITLASSSKHIIQILELLSERGLSFTFCANKVEMTKLAGLGVLFQGVTLDIDSKLLKDAHRTIISVLEIMQCDSGPGLQEFRRFSYSILPTGYAQPPGITQCPAKPLSDVQRQIQSIAAQYARTIEGSKTRTKAKSLNGIRSPRNSRELKSLVPSKPKSSHSPSQSAEAQHGLCENTNLSEDLIADTNLDYFPFPGDKQDNKPAITMPMMPNNWDKFLDSLGEQNVKESADDVYDWPPMDDILKLPTKEILQSVEDLDEKATDWQCEIWNLSNDTFTAALDPPTGSTFSTSDESLTSCEEACSLGDDMHKDNSSATGIVAGDMVQ